MVSRRKEVEKIEECTICRTTHLQPPRFLRDTRDLVSASVSPSTSSKAQKRFLTIILRSFSFLLFFCACQSTSPVPISAKRRAISSLL